MNSKLVLFLSVLSGAVMLHSTVAFANSCSAGKYSYLSAQCYGCPTGCYCPGVTGAPWHGHVYSTVAGWCSGRKIESYHESLGLRMCPSDFPKSDEKATSIEGCFAEVEGKKVYNKKNIKVPAGKYLPKLSTNPVDCTGERDWCKGIDNASVSLTQDQGRDTCASDKILSSDHTKCTDKASCRDNQIYNSATNTCIDRASCKKNEIYNPDTNSCAACPVGMEPDSSRTECVEASANYVQPGYYLPKGAGSKPKPCTEATYYCPGGNFVESTVDQGKIKCPKGSNANSKKTACSMKITMEQMKAGPKGNATPEEYQCWQYTGDAAKYKSCIFTNPYYN